MASLQGFITLLEGEYPDPKIRGKKFEPFLRDALKASPSHQFTNVWCWEDAPCYDGPDRGIDLVAEDINGGLWGIQSKLYDPDGSLTFKDLATWIATTRSDQWVGRLLVSTCPNLAPNAKKELLNDDKTLMLLGEDLFELPVEWPDTIRSKPTPHKPLEPKPHQNDAIKAITQALNDGQERVQAHMACGTGKTLVSLRVFEAQKSDLTVVLVPSISLMQQTIRSWTVNALEAFTYLPVCSDVKVAEDKRRGEDDDVLEDDLTSLDSPATTDPDVITAFLKSKGRRVVFCTYQSSDVLGTAAKSTNTIFDLVVLDEAHRTTGSTDSLFAIPLDNVKFPSRRRVFLTATPKIFAAADDEDETVASMDDTNRYGDVAYILNFGDAVKLGLLSDYQVVVIAIEDPDLRDLILDGGSLELDGAKQKIEASTLIALEGTLRAISEFGMTKIISFHSRIKRAKDFTSAVPVFDRWRQKPVNAMSVTVSGKMNAAERKKQIGWLEKNNNHPSILTNARCLTEGIDIPSLDAIVFADPRRSQIDIVQAVGRVMRTDPDNEDKIGRIIIPLVVPNENEIDGDTAFRDSAFKPVWDVVRALKAHDFRLEEELNRLRGLTALGPDSNNETFGVPSLLVIGIEDLEKFHLRVVQNTSPKFFQWVHGPLRNFIEREGHAFVPKGHIEDYGGESFRLGNWVRSQWKAFKDGRMSVDRIRVLDSLPHWYWNRSDAVFGRHVEALTVFSEREGHAFFSSDYIEDYGGESFRLGNWVQIQRRAFKDGRMSVDRIRILDSLPHWYWNRSDAVFDRNVEALTVFSEREGHTLPYSEPVKHWGSDIYLSKWVQQIRSSYSKGELDSRQIEALEAVPHWFWDNPDHMFFDLMIEELKKFTAREGHSVISRSSYGIVYGRQRPLGPWVYKKRRDYAEGKLDAETIAAFESVPYWTWEKGDLAYKFLRFCRVFRQYVEREGHGNVRGSHVELFEGEGVNLGNWVYNRRKEYADGRLPLVQLEALEELPHWVWANTEPYLQSRHIPALKQFIAREGHSAVPNKFVETVDGEEFNLGTFVTGTKQKWIRDRESLNPNLVADLEGIPNWDWNLTRQMYLDALFLRALKQFHDREGHINVPEKHIEMCGNESVKLNDKLYTLRRRKRKGTLSESVIDELESYDDWSWSIKKPAITKKFSQDDYFAALQRFIDREGHALVPISHKEPHGDGVIGLGAWVAKERGRYKQDEISLERVRRLEAIEGWVWSAQRNHADNLFRRGFGALTQFVEREGHTWVRSGHKETVDNEVINLNEWINRRRDTYRKGKLYPEHVEQLETVPTWAWDVDDMKFNFRTVVLRQFIEREKTSKIRNDHIELYREERVRLGAWVSEVRTEHRKGRLPDHHVHQLEMIHLWKWSNKHL